MKDQNDEDRLLDVHAAAEILGIKPSTLYQWAYERRIPVVKLLGRALRFRLSTIKKLIEDGERPALRPRGLCGAGEAERYRRTGTDDSEA